MSALNKSHPLHYLEPCLIRGDLLRSVPYIKNEVKHQTESKILKLTANNHRLMVTYDGTKHPFTCLDPTGILWNIEIFAVTL